MTIVKNKFTIGILAHVDAGKTTLSESILYQTGRIKELGRVDHKNAYLDTYELEKTRGITIFSKQALFTLGEQEITLLDTPGHVDFSAEMERTLRVLDYAILVINGSSGIQGHTLTVWKLLKQYHVPTFLFVNKMDLVGTNSEQLLLELQSRVDEKCIDFGQKIEEKMLEEMAVCDDGLMEQYLENGQLQVADIQLAIARRHVFPVYFGSALKNEGVKSLLEGMQQYMKKKLYPDIFGARVFKIIRDEKGERLTYVKVTGGSLKVKSLLTNKYNRNVELLEGDSEDVWQEKVNQIRVYSGVDYELVKVAEPGTVCALTGLSNTKPGDGLGFENQGEAPKLVPVLSYKVEFEVGTNVYAMLKNLRRLEEEEPHLNVLWNESLGEIHVQVMGEIQIEILQSTILDRFGVGASFDKGSLIYLESIESSVIGMGHFEPLKHYAEVHLLLEPLEVGSGMVYEAACSEDNLERHYQRLILTHLNEKKHKGVLTGSAISDMKVTLVAGKGHKKHTEGGDFREATFRALRQGLMKAKTVLLEPVYEFTLEIPKAMIGRAISDIERMQGRYNDPLIEGVTAILSGTAPVAKMMYYATEVVSYTKGLGRISLTLKGYEPCHNTDEVIDSIGYEVAKDVRHPSGSVFCSKGSGYGVPWEQADSHMHVDSGIRLGISKNTEVSSAYMKATKRQDTLGSYNDQELEAIFVKTYGKSKERLPGSSSIFDQRGKTTKDSNQSKKSVPKVQKNIEAKYLLVDGYNIIFSWDNLKELAKEQLDMARYRLMDILCDYQGQTGDVIILVFDAYRVAGNIGESFLYHNIHVVYTKEAETADQYIEKLVHKMRPNYEVTVATSDVLEQIIIMGKGARRMSAEGLKAEIDHLRKVLKEYYVTENHGPKNRPFEDLFK